MHIKLGLSLTALTGSAALLIGTLAACSTPPKPIYSQEQFATGISPFAHDFKGTPAQTCEAARRALLSQGYITTSTRFDAIDGSKNFQPDSNSHVVIEFHVVCAPGDVSEHSTVYVNALQDRYVLKKSSTNASVGLSVFGSLSLPIGSSDDAMVKVASETIPAGLFYERYFGLLTYYLENAPDKTSPSAATPKPQALPLPPVKAPEPKHALPQQAQVAPTAVTPPMPLPAVAIPAATPAATPAAAPVAASAAFTPDHVFVAPPVTTVGHGSSGADAASAATAQPTSNAGETVAPHATAPVAASVPAAASAPTAASASGAAPAGASAPAAASASTGASVPTTAIPTIGASAATAAATVATPATASTSAPTATASLVATSVPTAATGPSDVVATAATSTLATTAPQSAQLAAQPTDAAADSGSASAK